MAKASNDTAVETAAEAPAVVAEANPSVAIADKPGVVTFTPAEGIELVITTN